MQIALPEGSSLKGTTSVVPIQAVETMLFGISVGGWGFSPTTKPAGIYEALAPGTLGEPPKRLFPQRV
jgi:hypothetical protein